jgi:hypothetical protein
MRHAKNLIISCLALAAALAAAPAYSQDARAVPTYEAAGLYWSGSGASAATGCEVRFRKTGAGTWTQGLNMWLDARDGECRGSIVNLTAGTSYQVEMNLPGQPTARTLSFTTWSNQKPISRTVTVPSGSSTYTITEGGSASGYVVYQGAPGAVLDANNAAQFNVSINASYVIVRGLTLRGAQRDAIRISPTVSDVIIEDNDISGWGRLRTGVFGTDLDSGVRAICSSPTLQRVTIQRNEIHDPRYTANSWSDGHPQGPQAVTLSYCGGNNVIRHNEMFSTTGRYFNDIIGGEDNLSTTGFPNSDTDIYENELSHAWDDAIEAEGGNKNVRIWGNYIDRTGTGIASTITSVGPLYIFRNVYNRSRILQNVPPDQDDRQVFFKAGSNAGFGDGRRYIFHNTMLQAMEVGSLYGLGASGGISGTGSSQLLNNTVSRNNIFHNWRTWTAYYDVGTGNDFANDMYNGSAGAPDTNGIHSVPIYLPGNGWTSESGGMYQLTPATPGYDQGARIPNFNDVYLGLAPDVGAQETGSGAMKFGIAASPGPSAAPAPTPGKAKGDLNGDGKSDIVIRDSSNGVNYGWIMNGLSITNGNYLLSANSGWSIAAFADLDGDGKADILIQHTDGSLYAWIMNGLTVTTGGYILGAGTGFSLSHVGDFNGDGKADLIFKHTNGSIYVQLMGGVSALNGTYLQGAGSGWSVSHVADFDGDGKSDILLKHTDGSIYVDLMNGITVANGTFLQAAGGGWAATATGDFNGDGKADILITHTNGGVYLWQMNGLTITTGTYLLSPASGWSIANTADLDGDGKTDIVIKHLDGSHYAWIMNGTTVTTGGYLLGAASGWTISHVLDLNGDGKSDILIKHADGSIYGWLMNGTAIVGGTYLMGAGSWRVTP